MELWIPITLAAAFLQNLRSAFQKQLKGQLSTGGATFSRFIFAAPFAVFYAAILLQTRDVTDLEIGSRFLMFSALGGIAQIIATGLLVSLFSLRNFAVGTAYSKTETVQTALIGIVLLGETVTLGAGLGIGISLAGVLAMSAAQTGLNRDLMRDLVGRPAVMGLASAAFFGVAAVSYRAASLSLGGEGFFTQAALTLAVVLVLQTIAMGFWLRVKEPGQVIATIRAWRLALPAGFTGFAASVGWFTAMTIQNAAYVRAVGQIELVFTVLASWLFFREKIKPLELVGVALICAGIIVLVLRP